MNGPSHPGFNALFGFVDLLEELARATAREAKRRSEAKRSRARRGATLRPGPDTPLWNALVELTRPALQKRGSRAILARELGLHKARIGEFFDRRKAMPDAERTLLLLAHLARRARAAQNQSS